MLTLAYHGAIAAGSASFQASGDLPEDQPLPAANATLNASPSTLSSVYASAQAGNHIVLANGSYGFFNFNRIFPANNRLVIRAATLLGADFTNIQLTGSGHICSGLDVNTAITSASSVFISGNNNRFTRGRTRGAWQGVRFAGTATDNLFDHCELSMWSWRCVHTDDETPRRPIVARCWFHSPQNPGMGTTGAPTELLSTIAWGSENLKREAPIDAIVRFCYFSGSTAAPSTDGWDHVHNKTSGNIYAFNRFDAPADNNLVHNRFGLNCKFYGNYAPSMQFRCYDGYCDAFGNAGTVQSRCGAGDWFDDTDSRINWDGGTGGPGQFFWHRRGRIAGNQGALVIGAAGDASGFCGLNPQPCAQLNPGNHGFQADDPSHPRNGVHIYDNSQAPTFQASGCIDWVDNAWVFNNWQQAAPSSWAAELPSWVTDVVDVTDRSLSPWTTAQNLTPGSAATPNTGPFRDSPGGLL